MSGGLVVAVGFHGEDVCSLLRLPVKKNGPYSHSVQNRSSLKMSGENVAEKREEKAVDRIRTEAILLVS